MSSSDSEMTERKKKIFFQLFDSNMIHTFIRQIVKDSSSPLGESFRCGFMNREDMVERVERTEMDGIYSSLSHVSILRYDSREIGQEKIV